VENIFREVRNYALTNKTVDNKDIISYAAFIDLSSNKIDIFADTRDQANPSNEGKKDNSDYVFKTYQIPVLYKSETYNGNNLEEKNLTLFYEPVTAKFSFKGENPGDFNGNTIGIRIYEGESSVPMREKFIIFFKNSGAPESFDSLTSL